MDYLIHKLIEEKEAKQITSILLNEKEESWENGKLTAGEQAAAVKNNLQLNKETKTSKHISNEIIDKLKRDHLVKSFTIPRKFHSLMFTKTREGEGYGMHIDNAYMSSGRSDLSFTLFLNSPENYEGGELCIQQVQENKEIKLAAGQCIIYPSNSLHSVKNVTNGERIVCVGWIQSYIKSNEDRNLLFTIDAGAKSLLTLYGRSPALDLIFQAYGNLLRKLGD